MSPPSTNRSSKAPSKSRSTTEQLFMQEQNLNEVWQVDVNGTIYDAPFFELGEWIDGGSLLPEDKVRKGNLRWIEARRVPALLPFFNAKANGEPMPVVISTTVAEPAGTDALAPAPSGEVSPVEPPTSFVDHNAGAERSMPKVATDASICAMHAGIESAYICDGCANGFCKACPNSYGGTVKICPLCGAMCRPVGEVRESRHRSETLSRAIIRGGRARRPQAVARARRRAAEPMSRSTHT